MASAKRQLAVFVIHSAALKARATSVAKLRKIFGNGAKNWSRFDVVKFATIDAFEPADIPRDRIAEFAQVTAEGLTPPYDQLAGPLHLHQLSNALKHFVALQQIAELTAPGAMGLVLEDDVIYNEEALERGMADALDAADEANATTTADPCHILHLGLPSLADNKDERTRLEVVRDRYKCIPSCESYLVRPNAARSLASGFLPVRFPTHIHLSWLMFEPSSGRHTTAVGDGARLVTPSIFVDGSKYGTCSSSINANNRLTWNPWYIKMFNLIRGSAASPAAPLESEDDRRRIRAEVKRLHNAMDFKTHPDALYLVSLAHARLGEYEEARSLMESAMKAYESDGCILNRGSEFLNAYCDLHRHLQLDISDDTNQKNKP